MKITRRHLLISTGALAGFGATEYQVRPGPALLRFDFSEPHMGTIFKIVLFAPGQSAAAAASRAAFDRIAALDHIMSDYDTGSELIQLCRGAGGPPVEISEDLYRVMSAA